MTRIHLEYCRNCPSKSLALQIELCFEVFDNLNRMMHLANPLKYKHLIFPHLQFLNHRLENQIRTKHHYRQIAVFHLTTSPDCKYYQVFEFWQEGEVDNLSNKFKKARRTDP